MDSAEALISRQRWFDLVHPEDRERVAEADVWAGADMHAFQRNTAIDVRTAPMSGVRMSTPR
jgi:hypothetical protein